MVYLQGVERTQPSRTVFVCNSALSMELNHHGLWTQHHGRFYRELNHHGRFVQLELNHHGRFWNPAAGIPPELNITDCFHIVVCRYRQEGTPLLTENLMKSWINIRQGLYFPLLLLWKFIQRSYLYVQSLFRDRTYTYDLWTIEIKIIPSERLGNFT